MATPKRSAGRRKKSASATHSHSRPSDEFFCPDLSFVSSIGKGHLNLPRNGQMEHQVRSYFFGPPMMPVICTSYNEKGGCHMPRGRCMQLHICQHYINGNCRFGEQCFKSHNIFDPQPKAVLEMCCVDVKRSSKEVLAELRSGSADKSSGKSPKKMPDVCSFYNVISGCSNGSKCTRLHICSHYIIGGCKFGQNCKRSHNIFDPQPKEVLRKWGVNVARSPKVVLAELRSAAPDISENPAQASGGAEMPQDKDSDEICIYNLRGQCQYKGSCRNHHCTLPYQWQMQQTDGMWTDLSLSNNITCELTFCEPEEDTCCLVLPSGTVYKVDFDKFTISEGAKASPVRRLVTGSSVNANTHYHTFATKWCWYWMNNDGKWEQFLTQGNLLLPQTSVTSEDMEKMYKESPNSCLKFSTNEWAYRADFTKMCQYNSTTGRERQLRRRPEFVSQEDFEKLKSTPAKRSVSRIDSVASLPPQWDLADMGGDVQLKKLSKQSHPDEWGTVEKRFQESMPTRQIKIVHRIQNAELWENYSRKKHQMMKKSGTNIKELLLFHGTAGQYVDPICQQGFDWRISGLSVGTLYGKGSYFAKNSHYSRKYTDNHRLFVVQVLVGEFCAGDSTYVRPPPKDYMEPFGASYDSCVDKVHNPEIFVIFSSDQAYPAYLIEY